MTMIVTDDIVTNPAVVPTETEAVVAEGEARVALEEVIQEGETARAEIAAEVAETHIEAAAEVATAVTREELDECRRNIGTMQETLVTLSSQVQLISDELVREEPETPPNLQEPPVSGEADPQEAEPPKEPSKKKPRINWT